MYTPTRKSTQIKNDRIISANSTGLRSSSKSLSDLTPNHKVSGHNKENNDIHMHNINSSPGGISTFASKSSNLNMKASGAISRKTSRTYFQPPPGIGAVTSTPYVKSLSRSTSRSSSRLSLSSAASASISNTRNSNSPIYADSLGTINSMDINTANNFSKIKVTVRPKPLDYNTETYENSPWTLNFKDSQIKHSDLGLFQYDHVFSTEDDNDNIFDIVAAPIIEKCLNGYNGTIFAYGMTGSGKTYSMRGVMKNSVEMLFQNFRNNGENGDQMDEDFQTVTNDRSIFNDDTLLEINKYKVKNITCSVLEIYNEKIKDLLVVENTSYRNILPVKELRIIEDNKYGIQVRGLKEVSVKTPSQLFDLIDQGESSRCTDATDYNYVSSRSHFIVMLKVCMVDNDNNEITSVLNFCDLAGSERATSQIDRRKEGSYINKSLLALGTVITKLSENTSNTNAHIPYRDSKLTRILQPSLNGGSMVSILCTIQLGSSVVGETTNTLRFGSRAKNILLNVKRNSGEVDSNKLVNENEALKLEILELKNMLNESNEYSNFNKHESNGNNVITDDLYYELVAENNILNEQVEHLKRLQLEDSILRSQDCDSNISKFHALLDTLILDSKTRQKADSILSSLGKGLQEYHSRFNEIESYVGHLENRIRVSEIELARHKHHGTSMDVTDLDMVMKNGSLQDELVTELQEEILELKNSMLRKDAMIRVLQRAGSHS